MRRAGAVGATSGGGKPAAGSVVSWVLVADRARARVFAQHPQTGALVEVEALVNPEARVPERALTRDRPPRTFESSGPGRHSIEPHTTVADKVTGRFAAEVAARLARGCRESGVARLVVAASPGFLGALRGAFGRTVRARIVAEIDKDLSSLGPDEIRKRVAAHLGG